MPSRRSRPPLPAIVAGEGGGRFVCELAERNRVSRLAVVSNTEVFALAESLGGVESLIEQPGVMTHTSIPREERVVAGLSDGLVRAGVGVEHVDDLRTDLERAFEATL